ncbi:MAG: hypothetical protein LBG63_04850, partial [Candidatus Methanoplasma sp.]|nr:hypothetical protein [Candidatus Methanoplasma sp.]
YNTDKGSVYAHEAYGALVDPQHYAVCDGYSKAFLLLCEKEKIECVVVLGTAVASNMENHAWNYVKMDDGEWYAVDVTWNDDSSNAYFLLGGEKFFTTHQQGVFLSTGSNPFPFNAPAINKTGYDANDTDVKEMYAWILAAIMVIVISVALYRYAKNSN